MEKKCKHDKESECASCGEKFYLVPKEEGCNCQYEEGHSLKCPLYKKSKNPLEHFYFTTKKKEDVYYVQAGRTIKCGSCSPEFRDCKEIEKEYHTFKCECICHDKPSDFTTKKEESHDTKLGWCCACEYDIIELEEKIQQARQHERELIKNKIDKYWLTRTDVDSIQTIEDIMNII